MGKFQVLSLDLFQTLVDVNKRIPQIWQGILGSRYSDEIAGIGTNAIYSCFPSVYEQTINFGFQPMEKVYNLCAEAVVKQADLSVNAHDIAYHLMFQHGFSPFYEEVPPALEKLRKSYKLIICSDSNHLMVDPLLEQLDIDNVFISDDIEYYKGDLEGNFFKKVLGILKITSDKMLHIGDSYADILGAHKAGIATCWINRENKSWGYSIQPDYFISSFDELFNILEC